MNQPVPSQELEAVPSIDGLAEDFSLRLRRGEVVHMEEYVAAHPELADEIRDVFPAIQILEKFKPQRQESSKTPYPKTDLSPWKIGQKLGEYLLIREIGRGGMGIVYEAEQVTLNRRVALKVLPAHVLNNERLRERFRRESQAAARLHHTNIVPVFGVGEINGVCFYDMQLIDGQGLDQVLRQLQKLETKTTASACVQLALPDNQVTQDYHSPEGVEEHTSNVPTLELKSLPTEGDSATSTPKGVAIVLPEPGSQAYWFAIARIGLQVAEALSYAHSQGVLHRDIKPSNLLLDERGTVWITDFGVAKLVEEANLTQSGDIVGTLRYMPPERFNGISDPGGDIYALGITLYELLTLRPAFPDTTPQHLIRLITLQNLDYLRKIDPRIPKDLETIVLKAIARDPKTRYTHAEELAEDLRRFLDDRPILARRSSTIETFWRWCRRNPTVATLSAIAALLLFTVTVVSSVAYVRTAKANQDTKYANSQMELALEAEKVQRQEAETTTSEALEALNRIYQRFASRRLVATPVMVLESEDETSVEVPIQPVMSKEVAPLLEELLAFYEQLAERSSGYATLQAQVAEANQRIGDIRQRLGQSQQAITAYLRAIEVYEQQLDSLGDIPEIRIQLAAAFNELGRVYGYLRQTADEKKSHQLALQTLQASSKVSLQRAEFRFELAKTYYLDGLAERRNMPMPIGAERLGPGRGRGGRGGSSLANLGELFGPIRPSRPPNPKDPAPPPGEGPRFRPPNFRESPGEKSIQSAISILKDLVEEHPKVPDYRHLLAVCYRDQLNFGGPKGEGTKSSTTLAISILRELIQEYPGTPEYRFDLAETLARGETGRWFAYGRENGSNTTLQYLEEANRILQELMAEYPNVPQYSFAQPRYSNSLSWEYLRTKQADQAQVTLQKAIAKQLQLLKQQPESSGEYWLAVLRWTLSQVHRELQRSPEAEKVIRTSLDRLEKQIAMPKYDPLLLTILGQSYIELAMIQVEQGDKAQAEESVKKARTIFQEAGTWNFRPNPSEGGGGRPRGPGTGGEGGRGGSGPRGGQRGER